MADVETETSRLFKENEILFYKKTPVLPDQFYDVQLIRFLKEQPEVNPWQVVYLKKLQKSKTGTPGYEILVRSGEGGKLKIDLVTDSDGPDKLQLDEAMRDFFVTKMPNLETFGISMPHKMDLYRLTKDDIHVDPEKFSSWLRCYLQSAVGNLDTRCASIKLCITFLDEPNTEPGQVLLSLRTTAYISPIGGFINIFKIKFFIYGYNGKNNAVLPKEFYKILGNYEPFIDFVDFNYKLRATDALCAEELDR